MYKLFQDIKGTIIISILLIYYYYNTMIKINSIPVVKILTLFTQN